MPFSIELPWEIRWAAMIVAVAIFYAVWKWRAKGPWLGDEE